MYMSAGKFKAKCLKVMDQVGEYGSEVIVTKRGKPIAKMVPVRKTTRSNRKTLLGCLKHLGPIVIRGDIINYPREKWDAEKGLLGNFSPKKGRR